jgi:protein-ribulosamine 3-kinase
VTPDEAAAVGAALRVALGRAADAPERSVHGGCIGDAWRWPLGGGDVAFVKTAPATNAAMLEAEAAGLAELAAARAVRVPTVLAHGVAGAVAWLALEWLDLAAPTPASDARLGEALAMLHRVHADAFGWMRDNFIGRTPQSNAPLRDGVAFLRERRLRPQLELAKATGHPGRLIERGELLLENVDVFYGAYAPVPSLLHGDLWGGNQAALAGGEPIVFDPAPYFGDREADIAMTRLFGGFGPRFYAAYFAAWPLDAAHGYRRSLHNLYHVLNHLNLFGGSYAAQAESMIDGLLAEAGR